MEIPLQERQVKETRSEADSETISVEKGVSLEWNNLGYSIENSKTNERLVILEKLFGKINPGEMCAAIGPSGAGKSTFLDALAGRKSKKNMTGNVLVDGIPVNIKNISSYVMQDDSLIGNLTVRENILFSAELQVNASYEEKVKRCDQIIKEFGLEKVRDSKIGTPLIRGISGGQRRRVSIATQLVTFPKVLFLDEPTSGLDSAASFHVMEMVKKLAVKNKLTVICTIHQPNAETFDLFSKVLVLGSGRTLYFGPTSEFPAYFEKQGVEMKAGATPSDIVMNHVNIDFLNDREVAEKRITSLVSSWESKEQVEIDNQPRSTEKTDYANSLFTQTIILTRRIFLNARRNPLMFGIRFAMYIAMGVLVATSWINVGLEQNAVENRFAVLFFSVAFLSFMSVAGIPAFLEERFVFVREHSNGAYAVGPFVIANTLVIIPFIFLNAVVYSVIVYWAVGLNSGAAEFFKFLAFLYLGLMVAESLSLFISTILPIFVAALAITAFANGLFMVTQGFFLRADSINKGWKWVHYLNYQKYAFEALAFNDFSNLRFDCQKTPACFCKFATSVPTDVCQFLGEDVLVDRGYEDTNLGLWALYLVLILIFFRVAFFLSLRLRKYKE